MAEFEVKIQKIFITQHPNADALDVGHIGSPDGWQVVVRKGSFKDQDLCAYIGENSVVPEWILKKYGFWNEERNKGMLAGSLGDRVKGIRLRNEFSLGICIPTIKSSSGEDPNRILVSYLIAGEFVEEGDDVTELLGITKFEPTIPAAMFGQVYNGGTNIGVNYDVENIKNHSTVLQEGEQVQITEKLHGINFQVVVLPIKPEYHHEEHLFRQYEHDPDMTGYIAVSSKGQGGKGLFLKHNKENENNVYLKTTYPIYSYLINALVTKFNNEMFTVVGEIFGHNIQDLTYGMTNNERSFRVFDVYLGERGRGRWLEDSELDDFCAATKIERVPMLYRGPYSKELAHELSQHTKSVFDSNQIREGVVIKAVPERTFHNGQCRVSLKLLNEDYLTRKGVTTEFN
ncbi:RNA ligase (ATP) [Candidatus Dojkabacteria bacterium]|jgi:RNA ligase (TIGR02306 family)|nr:RNA ligase (ATP) [Candidatus Dojkabacteria bacterium]